jgi:hypothetical protein
MLKEADIRKETIGNLSFENKEEKDRFEQQVLGFRKLRDVLIPTSLILLFVLIWCFLQ